MRNEEFVEKIYQSETEGSNKSGGSFRRWKGRQGSIYVKEALVDGESLNEKRSVWRGRSGDSSGE